MTVDELVEKLKKYPGNTLVLVDGYESGFNDIRSMDSEQIIEKFSREWYEGKYVQYNVSEPYIDVLYAVVLRR